MINRNGFKSKWLGEQTGRLEYHANGTVVVLIQRQAKSNTDNLSSTDRKKLYISYLAKFDIISENIISHTIIESNHLERVGSQLVRGYILDKKLLIISGKGLSENIEIVWERQSI